MLNAIICVAAAAAIGLGAYFISGKADTPVEEAAEAYIEQEMGLEKGSIDLTPETKEGAENLAPKKPSRKRDNA